MGPQDAQPEEGAAPGPLGPGANGALSSEPGPAGPDPSPAKPANPQTELEQRIAKSLVGGFYHTSVPPLLSNLATGLLVFTDGLVITNLLGPSGMAALNYSSITDYLLRGVATIFSTGGLSVMSTLIGSEQNVAYRDLVPSGLFWVNVVMGLLCYAILQPTLRPLYKLIGAQGNTLDYAVQYSEVLVWGAPLYMFSMTYSYSILAEGLSYWNMVCAACYALFNALFSFLFIRYTEMGIRGGSIGTLVSMLFVLAVCIFLYSTKRMVTKIRPLLVFRYPRETLRLVWKMFVIGLGDGLQHIAFGFTFSLYNYYVSQVVPAAELDQALTGVGSMTRVYNIYNAVSFSFGSLGYLPVAGLFVGRRDKATFHRVTRIALFTTSGILLVLSALSIGLQQYLALMFSRDVDYLRYFQICAYTMFPLAVLSGIKILLISYGQALGTSSRIVFSSVLCLVLYLPIVLTIFFFSFKSYLGLMLAYTTNDTISSITCLAIYWKPLFHAEGFIDSYVKSIEEKKKKKKEEEGDRDRDEAETPAKKKLPDLQVVQVAAGV